jgi:hypothetical protein
MEDGEKKQNVEKDVPRQSFSSIFNVGTIFQSVWIRCRSVFPNTTDGKFMESELRFVLYCGVIFWTLYLVYEVFK